MNGLRHAFTGALYEPNGTGCVLVTDGDRQGRFRPNGSWISGDLRECDTQLCGWVAGPRVTHHRIADASSDH